MARSSGQTVTIGGHRLRLTHPDKVLYPATGTTKADVIAYYVEVAPFLLPHVAGRPATRKRWPDGVGDEGTTLAGVPGLGAPPASSASGGGRQTGTAFFEKNLPDSAPSWIHRVSLQHKERRTTYPLIDDVAVLAWLGQQAALELHVPQWRVGAHGRHLHPDRFVLDLDPGPGAGLPECVEVATTARDILDDLGLTAYPVTSGSKGLHLYAGLDGTHDADYVNAFAKQLAQALEAERPDLVVSSMKKSSRHGKVLADWSQNNGAKTTVAPYSLRGREHPTVAVPRDWDELDDGLRQLDLDEVLERLDDLTDPMGPLGVDTAGTGARPPVDRLTVYRSKRDASTTPEPVPDAAPVTRDGEPIFVIQEHHATALHHDVRLERDGVLVSWAVPKGIPPTTRKNHLAVPTEDHPMEYAGFEGSIPGGEYGAGTVTIWDSGTYETVKWRDDEVIVVLHGRDRGGLHALADDGRVKVALIRTGKNWLLHRMDLDGSTQKARLTQSAHPEEQTARPRSRRTAAETSSVPYVTAEVTQPIAPMLARPADQGDIDDEADWAFEMKWDGVRIVAYADDDAVALRGRSGRDATATYPEVAQALAGLGLPGAVLDGEVVALDESGTPSFSLLQQRMGLTTPREVAAAGRAVGVRLLVFDLLRLDGHGLATTPYDDRRALLHALDLDGDVVSVPAAFEGSREQAVAESLRLRLEGVVAKRRASRYLPGKRSASWLKLKHERMTEVVVVGWRPGRGERTGAIGSLLVAVPDAGGDLVYAGRVGTGFRDDDLARLDSLLHPLERRTAPVETPREVAREAVWVTPRIVGEVSYGEWTDAGHLRHPVWRGLRPDRSTGDLEHPEDRADV